MKQKSIFSAKNILIAFFSLMALSVTITTIVLLNQKEDAKDTRTSITGLPDNIPKNIKGLIEAGLYDTIALNIPSEETPPKTGAIIRNDTLSTDYDKDTDIYYGDFITDIESVKQSFSIHYEWSKNDKNPYISGYPVEITCVDKSNRIYNTSSCSDAFHQADPEIDNFASEYLPYTSKTDNGIDYSIVKDYPDRDPVITVISYTCEGSDNATKVKNAAVSWLKTKDDKLDLNTIEYKYYCDGMMDNFPPLIKVN